MVTINELVEGYYLQAKEVIQQEERYSAKSILTQRQLEIANKIVQNINSLVWQETNIRLSKEEKIAIVEGFENLVVTKEANNSNYLLLIAYVSAQIKK